jgi:uncharacterized protein (DUF1778 family)
MENAMPRVAVEDNSRMSLRIRAEEMALLLRAVALQHTDLTDFVVQHALRAAKSVIEEAEKVQLSERDSLRVLDLLENPPAANAKLLAAAQGVPPWLRIERHGMKSRLPNATTAKPSIAGKSR